MRKKDRKIVEKRLIGKRKNITRKIYIKNIVIFLALVAIIAIVIFFASKRKETSIINMSSNSLLSQNYDVASDEDAIIKDDKNNVINGIEFDAFFLAENESGEEAKRVRGACNKIGEQSNLYIKLAVKEEGYIKDGIIDINSNNFYFNTSIIKDTEVANNCISPNTKTITLNNINNGTDKILMGSVRSGNYSSVYNKTSAIGNDTNKYNKENTITFSGTFVENSEERHFTKTVPIKVDWYGNIDCMITPQSQTSYVENFNDLKTEEGICLETSINVAETLNELIMSGSYISGTIPELNGYKATNVEILGKNVEYTYNGQTGEFTAQREAEVDENGIVISNAYTNLSANDRTIIRNNKFDLKIIYPLKAFEEMDKNILSFDLVIPIEAVNKGYNNQNENYGFMNPESSEITKGIIVTYWNMDSENDVNKAGFSASIGKYYGSPYNRYLISKEKPMNIYNGKSLEENDDTYTVVWKAYTGTEGKSAGIIMKEVNDKTDCFLNSSGQYISMENLTTNIAISFSGAADALGRDGWIKVYNEENNTLLTTFTYRNWNSYTQEKPYYYENSVKHIRVETSMPNEGKHFYVYNKKELDDNAITEQFTLGEFENLLEIQTHLEGWLQTYSEGDITNSWPSLLVSTSAYYSSQTSIASFSTSIENNILSTQSTAEHEKIIITTNDFGYNEQKWKNGTFLIKMPKEILLAEVNDITVDNENVEITAYDVYEENGVYFIKILTENEQEEIYKITIDCNLTPDPRVSENRQIMELYAMNEIAYDYHYHKADIYDIDGDLNIDEQINYQSIPITFNPGSALNTTQTASNYNEENSVTIAPRIAVIDKSQKTATISVSAINYYDSNLEEIKILGVVPFKGNNYILSGNNLGSTFTTYMNKKGITTLTPELQDKVTIYYSTQENPTNDEKDSKNKWTLYENVTDWNAIKTYLIVVDNSFYFPQGTAVEFQYEISLPNDTKYNDIAYSQHALYYALATDKGLLRTSTSCSKLGFMIAKQYSLEIEKYQEDTNKLLNGVTFSLTEDGAESSTIKTTNKNGIITIPKLFAEKHYILKEQKVSNDYALNNEEIRFYTYTDIDNSGNEKLHIVYVNEDGSYSELNQKYHFIKSANVKDTEEYAIKFEIEDKVRPKLEIKDTDIKTDEALKNIKYTLTGKGKNGDILITDENGQISTSGLYLDEEYTLKEIESVGYYLQNDIIFKIINNNGNFEIVFLNDSYVPINTIEKQDEIPTIKFNMSKEKIPTYGLQLVKYAKNETETDENGVLKDKVLPNAQYKIYGDGIAEKGKLYTTNENGIITIDGLYEYVEGKNITGEYRLVEIYAPSGYSVNSSELKFKLEKDIEGKSKVTILEGEDVIKDIIEINESTGEKIEIPDISVDDSNISYPIINIGVDDGAIFSLYKYRKDPNTGEKIPVPGSKFIITDLEGNYVKGTDGKIIGDFVDTTPDKIPVPEVIFSSNTSYKWTQDVNGVWKSGNKGKKNTTSSLTSNEFELLQDAILTFDWSVSSDKYDGFLGIGAREDYAYYTITNIENGKILESTGESATKISGTNYGTNESDLRFINESIELPAGTYKIEFTYKKDSSRDAGLDAGFVKNVRLETEEVEPTGYAYVTTDENGFVTANIGEGNYKAIEIEAPEGFILPENEEDRTYYFYVGPSESAKYDWANSIKGRGWNYINSVSQTKDDGVIAVGSFSEYSNEVIENATDGVDINNDGIIDNVSKGNNDGIIVSYDTYGKVRWAKTFGGTEDDSFNKVIQTSDNGYAVVGYVTSKNVKFDDVEIAELSKKINFSGKDAVLLKLDSLGNYQWGVRLGGILDEEIKSVIETSQGNLAIIGDFYSSTFSFYSQNNIIEKATISNRLDKDGFIASYSNTGEYQWSQSIGGTGYVEANDITEYSNGLAVAVYSRSSVYPTSDSLGLYLTSGIIGYNLSGSYNSFYKNIESIGNSKITSIDTDLDGSIISSIVYSNGKFDAGIYKTIINGTSERIYTLTGVLDEYITDVKVTSDGGILFGGWYYSEDVSGSGLEGKYKLDGYSNGDFKSNGYIIKLNSERKVVYSSMLSGNGYSGVNGVAESTDGRMVSCGFFNVQTLSATNFRTEDNFDEDLRYSELISNGGNFDGFVISEGAIDALIPERQSIEVENKLEQFSITTEIRKHIEEESEIEGGQIICSIPDESVYYGYESNGEITIKPDNNYTIKNIQINNKDYTTYKLNEDGSVTLDKFKNVKENKHIIVEFIQKEVELNLVVNHYLWSGDLETSIEKVAESEYYIGKKDEKYTVMPNVEINYDIITNFDYYGEKTEAEILEILEVDSFEESNYKNAQEFLDDLYIPKNYTGVYNLEKPTIIVNYYYKEKTYKLTVHHYLEGTIKPVPLKDPDSELLLDPDERYINQIYHYGDLYETTKALDNRIDYQMYELVSIPENSKGTINQDIEITYYYKVRTTTLNIIKVAKENNEIALGGTEFALYELHCDKHNEEYHDSEFIDYEKESSCWKRVKEYTAYSDGTVSLENLDITNEFRLIETKALENRYLPKGQWKINFKLEKNSENDEIVIKNEIISLGDAPKIKCTEDGKILIENANKYKIPITGGIGKERFFIVGIVIMLITIIKFFMNKKRDV